MITAYRAARLPLLLLPLLAILFSPLTKAQTRVNPAQISGSGNGVAVCDGVVYKTIQAAAASLPAAGGEVIVTTGSTCTWNGAGLTGSVRITFLASSGATGTYAVTAPVVMTNGNNHIVCSSGQGFGLTNNTVAIELNFTGSLSTSQDAISASGVNNNDNNSVEGCYILGAAFGATGGRSGIHFSGSNGNRVLNNTIRNFGQGTAGSSGIWIDGSSATNAHSYENRIQGNDVIHINGDGYLVSTDPAGTGFGGDVDGTILDHNDYHPREVGGSASLGQGCHILVPSTATTGQAINATIFTKFLSNGSVNATYGCLLEADVVTPTRTFINNTVFLGGELEDVYQTNSGIALKIINGQTQPIATGTPINIQNLWFSGGLGSGFSGGSHNINASNQTVAQYWITNSNATFNAASAAISQAQTDVLTVPNLFSSTTSWCNPGIAWNTNTGGNYKDEIGSDGVQHFLRFDGATSCTGGGNFVEWMQWDRGNKVVKLLSSTNLDASGGTGGIKLKDQGTCTMASGACTVPIALGHTYVSAPQCFATWNGTGTLTGFVKLVASTSQITALSSSVNTDTAVMNWACFGL